MSERHKETLQIRHIHFDRWNSLVLEHNLQVWRVCTKIGQWYLDVSYRRSSGGGVVFWPLRSKLLAMSWEVGTTTAAAGSALLRLLGISPFWHLAKSLIASLKFLRGMIFSSVPAFQALKSLLYRIHALQIDRSMAYPKSLIYYLLARIGVL